MKNNIITDIANKIITDFINEFLPKINKQNSKIINKKIKEFINKNTNLVSKNVYEKLLRSRKKFNKNLKNRIKKSDSNKSEQEFFMNALFTNFLFYLNKEKKFFPINPKALHGNFNASTVKSLQYTRAFQVVKD